MYLINFMVLWKINLKKPLARLNKKKEVVCKHNREWKQENKQTQRQKKKKKKSYAYTKKFSASVDHIWMRWKTFNIIQLTIMINSPKKLRIENS